MQKHLFWVALVAAFSALLVLAYPALNGTVYTSTDLADFHIPVRAWYQDALEKGNSFIWYPYSFRGYYIHAEGQAALYHPLNLISYPYLSFETAFNLEFLRSYFFLLCGGFFLFLRFGLGTGPALFGSFLFAFSSFNVLHYMHLNIVGAAGHIPWLLLATDVVIRSRNQLFVSVATLSIVLLTASSLLLGHPQVIWMSVMAQALYAVFLLLSRGTLFSTISLRLIAAQLLGLASAGIQTVPLYDAVSNSFRAGSAVMTEQFVNLFGLNFQSLAQLFAPYWILDKASGSRAIETDAYCGALFPVLLVWLLLRWRNLGTWKPWVGFSISLFLLSIWLGLGKEAGLYQIQSALPVIGLFRAPGRYIALVQLASAILVAIAFADLCKSTAAKHRGRTILWLFLPAAISGLLASFLLSDPSSAQQFAGSLWGALAGPSLFAIAALLVAGAARHIRGALPLIILFGCIDVFYPSIRYVWRDTPKSLEEFIVDENAELDLVDFSPAEGYRVLEAKSSLALRGVRKLWGYRALYDKDQLKIFTVLLAPDPDQAEPGAIARSVLSISSVDMGHLAEDDYEPMPRTRLVTRTIQSKAPHQVMGSIDPKNTAVVDREIILTAGTPGTAELIEESPGFIRILTRSQTEQLLVVSESFHPGWQAHTDSKASEIFRTYDGIMGILVGPGERETVLRFEPESLRYGKWLTASGILIAVLWFLYDLWGLRGNRA